MAVTVAVPCFGDALILLSARALLVSYASLEFATTTQVPGAACVWR